MVANNAGEEKIETNANGKMEIIYLMIIFELVSTFVFVQQSKIFIMPAPRFAITTVFRFTNILNIHILTEMSEVL